MVDVLTFGAVTFYENEVSHDKSARFINSFEHLKIPSEECKKVNAASSERYKRVVSRFELSAQKFQRSLFYLVLSCFHLFYLLKLFHLGLPKLINLSIEMQNSRNFSEVLLVQKDQFYNIPKLICTKPQVNPQLLKP